MITAAKPKRTHKRLLTVHNPHGLYMVRLAARPDGTKSQWFMVYWNGVQATKLVLQSNFDGTGLLPDPQYVDLGFHCDAYRVATAADRKATIKSLYEFSAMPVYIAKLLFK